jgi:hypothetical protein
VAFLLMLGLLFSFAACDAAQKKEKKPTKTEKKEDSDESYTPKPTPTETEPEENIFSSEIPLTVEDAFSATVVNFFVEKDVKPPIPPTYFTHYEAEEGFVYAALVVDVKYFGTEEVNANAVFVPVATIAGEEYTPFVLVEENGGTELSRGSYTKIVPLQTARLYFLYSVPENVEISEVSVSVTVGEQDYTGTFTREEFANRTPILAVGEEIIEENMLSAKLESVEFTDIVKPSNPEGVYHFYEAGKGNRYLAVKFRVTNLQTVNLSYDTIAGISCIYQEKYRYSFTTVFETDNGEDLSSYANLYGIAPGEEGIVYYLAKVPEEVENGPVEIKIYIAGNYYKIMIEESSQN